MQQEDVEDPRKILEPMTYGDVWHLFPWEQRTSNAWKQKDTHQYYHCILSKQRTRSTAQSIEEGKLAVETGYWSLYRYDPSLKGQGKNPFQLDSNKITEELKTFLSRENRFTTLERSDPSPSIAELKQEIDKKFSRLAKLAE